MAKWLQFKAFHLSQTHPNTNLVLLDLYHMPYQNKNEYWEHFIKHHKHAEIFAVNWTACGVATFLNSGTFSKQAEANNRRSFYYIVDKASRKNSKTHTRTHADMLFTIPEDSHRHKKQNDEKPKSGCFALRMPNPMLVTTISLRIP